MKIELTCSERRTFKQAHEVYALTYDLTAKAFSMPLCVGDDWLQKITCPQKALPVRVHLQWD